MDKLASLVPEIYYDLIARVVPGSVLCVILAVSVNVELAPLQLLGGALLSALALLISYATGFVLDIFSGALLEWPNRGIFWVLGRVSSAWQTDVWEAIANETSGAHAAKLTKMMAERALLRSLMVLSVALWLLESWPMGNLSTQTKAALVIVIVLVYYRMEFWVRFAAERGKRAAT